MPRLPSDPVARLPQWEAARKTIGRKRVVLNASEMAQALGMTLAGFKKLMARDPEVPVISRGAEGVPYEFDAAKVLDHLIASARATVRGRERRRAGVLRLAGLGPAGSALSPADAGGQQAGSGTAARDTFEEARALEKLIDVRAKLRVEMERHGQLLERGLVSNFLWRWLSSLQSEVLAIEGRIDKANRMEPATRRAVKDELAKILVGMRARLEEFIGPAHVPDDGSDRGRSEPPRRRRNAGPDRGHRRTGAGPAHPA